ncbi:PadR family transcriptional regulator [Gordonia neofelifaecis]|uniref:Transcriptional regulator PadR family protein n=1 Tax=Gordonia neofelifaecis NRRL B-59395 TaxID=644548 RepID=F1YKW4_9ACTN|nr:PadR family transcriptional regulator [Gordonia neofelifaecis]EGD54758.1 transcriptional regulator PadR family protein [Gordonia neofelifaecis NRRL B-59395]
MSVTTTRLLLLGAVGLFEPVNGYQIRRELLSWRVDEWASIKPGSIYHGLRSLADQGLMSAQTVADGGRDVVVYQLTDAGRAALEDAIVSAVVDVNVFDRHAFQAAFGLLPMLGGERAEDALRRRRAAVRQSIPEILPPEGSNPYAPPHAVRSLELWKSFAEVELHWLDGVLDDIGAGRLDFDGTGRWAQPADDPGYQMMDDRERYRAELGGRRD